MSQRFGPPSASETREWVHRVLTTLWGGEEYLPEDIRQTRDNIPTLTLGHLANLYLLQSTHARPLASLWDEDGILRRACQQNQGVLCDPALEVASMELHGVLGINANNTEHLVMGKPPPCDISRFRELGSARNNSITVGLSNFMVDLDRQIDDIGDQIAEELDHEEIRRMRNLKLRFNVVFRLPIAGFISRQDH
ncbi:unnamed protein product [Clonostachys rosea]|uniref:Uncharacterized protein n=1 Tax=Bionectria ochroleuca TaxID=29856 RepID=A0ABY6UUV6_BIOOC|nr:unnamed protein product [Clonostachys rosea]